MSVTVFEIHPIRPEAALLPNGERVAASEGLTGVISAQAPTPAPLSTPPMSRVCASVVVTTVAGVSFLNTLGSGLLTIGLPRIAADLNLASNLLLWPASIFALTAGCTLLVSGAIADVVGNRPVFLTGCALLSAFTLGYSLSQTGIQLIIFRALQGITLSLCMPTAVSLITNNFPTGKRRNMAFAFLGGGQPIGFALGLVLGGILVDSISWRVGYYISCGINAVIFIGAFFSVPSPTQALAARHRLGWNLHSKRLYHPLILRFRDDHLQYLHYPSSDKHCPSCRRRSVDTFFCILGWQTGKIGKACYHTEFDMAQDRFHKRLHHSVSLLGPI